MSKVLDMDGHADSGVHKASAPGIGPDLSFAPRPYPRRAPGESILRGRRVLVIDSDVTRGRRVCRGLRQEFNA